MEKPTIEYHSRGPTGNIYWILAATANAMRRQRRINAYNEVWERVQNATSYQEALDIIGEVVNLVDLDEKSKKKRS